MSEHEVQSVSVLDDRPEARCSCGYSTERVDTRTALVGRMRRHLYTKAKRSMTASEADWLLGNTPQELHAS